MFLFILQKEDSRKSTNKRKKVNSVIIWSSPSNVDLSADLLSKHQDLPGIILSQPLKQTRVTPRGKEICREDEIGVSLSIPRDSVNWDVDICIGAGFSGSHKVPDDMEPVSPPYMVTSSREMELKKAVTLRMQHNLASPSEEILLMEADGTQAQSPSILRRSAKKVQTRVYFGVVKFTKLACKTI